MTTKYIAITGSKKSGKSTTIESLVPQLKKKDFKVGTVKIAFKEVSIDVNQEHYDVVRLRKENPTKTMFKSKIETVIFYNEEMTLRDALKDFGKGLDFVLIEGFPADFEGFPQIALLKEANKEKEIINDYTVAITSIPEFSVKSDNDLFCDFEKLADIVEKKSLPLIPNLNCGHCGFDDCKELVKEIVRGNKTTEDCIIVQSENAHLSMKINEKTVPCNPFVQEIFKNTILAIVKSLKIEEKDVSEIDIKILLSSKDEKEIFR